MRYVLGVDSGGTKYLIKACDLQGRVLASYIGPSAYHYRVGNDTAAQRIAANVSACLEAFGGRPEDCLAITVGTTGLDAPGDDVVIEAFYRQLSGFSCPIQVVNDAEVAHYAATGGVGVLAIGGTGSIAFGRNGQGETFRCGGWLPCIGGDEGSGTWLARQALGYYSRVLDGREAGGLLADWLRERLSLAGSRELMDLSQAIQQDTFRDPGISRWVDEAAQAGDPVAEALITQAGRLVAQLALGVIRQLHFPSDEPVTVGVWGSVIVNSRLHREAFTQAIHADYPLAQIIIPEKDAADGALMMALQLCR